MYSVRSDWVDAVFYLFPMPCLGQCSLNPKGHGSDAVDGPFAFCIWTVDMPDST